MGVGLVGLQMHNLAMVNFVPQHRDKRGRQTLSRRAKMENNLEKTGHNPSKVLRIGSGEGNPKNMGRNKQEKSDRCLCLA